MSTLKADTIQNTSGGAATLTKQSPSKSFVNFDMAGTTARDSFNLSSLTDRATGKFTVNLSSAHANANYACVGYTNAYNADGFAGGMSLGLHSNFEVTSTGSAYAFTSYNGAAYVDAKFNSSATHGDLA